MSQPERQEIAPGIILEKIQERVKRKKHLVLKLEVQIFNCIEIVVDFEGSENVKLKSKEKSLEIKTIVQPFKKTQIARLKLERGWTLKTNFKINKLLPPLELQKQYLEEVFEKQKHEISEVKLLESKCMNFSNLEMVFDYLKQHKAKFLDFDFQPNYQSLGIEEDNFIDIHNCYCHWRRLKYIYLNMGEVNKVEAMPYIYKKEITPTDVKLGKINFSWLLSAIACVAEKPFLIKRIIKTKDSNDYGIFKVKLCHNGLWQEILLDDFFPCYPFSDPIFDSNIEEDFWVLLLEKAFAKMHGSYASLTQGNCLQGLYDMTNCPTFEVNFAKVNEDEIWKDLKKWLKYEYLLCAMSKEIDDQGDFIGTSKELTYSIKRVYEDGDLRLIQLRNLWGVFDWKGEWSNKSKTWTEEIKKKVQPNLEDQTHFWMDFKHFIKNFVKMYVCYTRSWHEIKIKGKFVMSTEEQNPNVKNWCSKWGYEIEIKEQTKVVFGIHQKDERDLGAKQIDNYIDIGIDIIKQNGDQYDLIEIKNCQFQREIFIERWLRPGKYIVIPKSVGIDSFQKNPFFKDVVEYTLKNPLMIQVLRDVFKNFDFNNTGKVTYDQVQALMGLINKDLNEEDFLDAANDYGIIGGQVEFLTQKSFVQFIGSELENLDQDKRLDILQKLGYDENLICKKLKLFTFSSYTDQQIDIRILNCLNENLDFISTELRLEQQGQKVIDLATDSDVCLMSYQIEFKNQNETCVYYGVKNDSKKSVKVTVDLSEENNIQSHVKNMIITKTVKPGKMKFMLNSQILFGKK